MPLERPFSWGTIRVVDRLEVFNSFLTFGGTVRAVELDAATTIVRLLVARPDPPLDRAQPGRGPLDR